MEPAPAVCVDRVVMPTRATVGHNGPIWAQISAQDAPVGPRVPGSTAYTD
jgi:hypothetical protein